MKTTALFILLSVSVVSFAQNKYLLPYIKTSYSGKTQYVATEDLFIDDYKFSNKEYVEGVGVYFKKLDFKKAKTDTLGIGNVILKDSEVSYGILSGAGKFIVPPVYSLYVENDMLGQKLKNNLWKALIFSVTGDLYHLPENLNYWTLNYNLILFETKEGKYGMYDDNARLLLEPVYDSVEILDAGLIPMNINKFTSLDGCFNSTDYRDCRASNETTEKVMFVKFENPHMTTFIDKFTRKYNDTEISVNWIKIDNRTYMYYKLNNDPNEILSFDFPADKIKYNIENASIIEMENRKKDSIEVARLSKIKEEENRIKTIESNPNNYTSLVIGQYEITNVSIGSAEYRITANSLNGLRIETKDFNLVKLYLSAEAKFADYSPDVTKIHIDADLPVSKEMVDPSAFAYGEKSYMAYVLSGYKADSEIKKGEMTLKDIKGNYNPEKMVMTLYGTFSDGQSFKIIAVRRKQL